MSLLLGLERGPLSAQSQALMTRSSCTTVALVSGLVWRGWPYGCTPGRMKIEELEGERSRLEEEKKVLEAQLERFTLQVSLGDQPSLCSGPMSAPPHLFLPHTPASLHLLPHLFLTPAPGACWVHPPLPCWPSGDSTQRMSMREVTY